MSHKKPLTVASRNVTLRDFAIFQVKLLLDGMKDGVALALSIVAITLDFIAGRGRRPRLFYSVVRASERFDKWINLHSVLERMDAEESEDGHFGGSDAGADILIGQIEQLVRGGDKPRSQRADADGDIGSTPTPWGGEPGVPWAWCCAPASATWIGPVGSRGPGSRGGRRRGLTATGDAVLNA
jgi:hypothetical protein